MTHIPTQPDSFGAPGPTRHGEQPGRREAGPVRFTGTPRRRRLPYLLLGVLLVLGCAVGGVVTATQLGHREAVLELARPVSVGQLLSAADVREVSISTDTGLAVIPANKKSQAVGSPLAYSLPAGALLTKDLLGPARVPPPGQAVAAVGLTAGHFPPDLQPGNRVTVVVAPTGDAATGTPAVTASQWAATVTGVHADATNQTTVVSLQLADGDARQLAAAPAGQVSVVIVPGGAR